MVSTSYAYRDLIFLAPEARWNDSIAFTRTIYAPDAYRKRLCVTIPRVPPFVSSPYDLRNAANVYILLHERLPVQQVLYAPHKARNMAP